MEIPKGQQYKTIVDLGDVQIKADLRSWVLFIPPRTLWYYTSLECLFEDLLDLKIKSFANKSQKKDIESFGKAIAEANNYIAAIIKGLTSIKSPASERLDRVCKGEKQKDD